jgi:hypothetical protein
MLDRIDPSPTNKISLYRTPNDAVLGNIHVLKPIRRRPEPTVSGVTHVVVFLRVGANGRKAEKENKNLVVRENSS